MVGLRVVLDTKVLVSGIAYPASVPGKVLEAWRHGSLDVVLSDHILKELVRVLPRLAHRHGLSAAEVADLVDVLAIQAELLEPAALHEPELRDVDDRPVVGTPIAALRHSETAYLVTGDTNLLALAARYPTLSPAEFWARHGGA